MRNRLLCALPPDIRTSLQAHLTVVALADQDVLFAPSASIAHVFFPETAVVSLQSDQASLTDTGGPTGGAPPGYRMGEAGTIGYEGLVGLELLLHGAGEGASAFRRAVVEMPGTAQRMEATVFTALAEPSGALHRVLLRYTEGLLTQMAQAAACNARHRLEPRCAGWLLATHDRVAADTFPAPLESIAAALGVRRAGIAVVLHALHEAGLIDTRGTAIRILDPHGLAAVACGCHQIVRARYARLLPPSA